MTDKYWIAQLIVPTLPADTREWRITRIQLRAKVRGGANGVTAVQIRDVGVGDRPGDTIIDTASMVESNLTGSYAWQEFSFPDADGLSPAEGVMLALTLEVDDNHLATVEYDAGAGTGMCRTNNGGTSWAPQVGSSLLLNVYGTVTTPGDPNVITTNYGATVNLRLQVGDDSANGVQICIQLLNTPEIATP